MRTSLTILTILAAAGTAVAAPTPHTDRHHGDHGKHHGKHGSLGGAVEKLVTGHHRRSDSRVVIDMTEHLTDPHHKGYKMTEHDIEASKHAIKTTEHKVEKIENRRSRRAVVSLFPEQDPGSKAGVADAKNGKMNAHIIQTPGKDQTIVEVQSGKLDGKVNLPKEVPAPIKDMTDSTNSSSNGGKGNNAPGGDLFGGAGKNLSGKGGPPGLEISLGENRQPQQQPSKAPTSSRAPVSSAKPTSSAGPKSSASSRPASSSSSSVSRAPPRSSSSTAAPKSSASPNPSSKPAAPAHPSSARPSASSKPAPSKSASPVKPSSSPKPAPGKASPSPQPLVHLEVGNPAILNGQGGQPIVSSKEPLIDLDVANPSILSGLVNKPVIALGKPGSKSNTNANSITKSMPSKIKFGDMPKHTAPCDGIHARDNDEMVEVCIRADMLNQRPKDTHACPEYNQHDIHAHYYDKTEHDELSKAVSDYVRLCVGAGAV